MSSILNHHYCCASSLGFALICSLFFLITMASVNTFKCNYCNSRFNTRELMLKHMKTCKVVNRFCPLCGNVGCSNVTCKHEDREMATPPHTVQNFPEALEVFEQRWSAIETGVRTNGPVVSQVNIRLPTGELSDAVNIVRRIHTNQRSVYKMGLSVGLILQHKENGEYRYFHASQNNAQLTAPFRITNSVNLERTVITFLVTCDTIEEVKKLVNIDTKWRVISATNVNVSIYKCTSKYPIGATPRSIPSFMRAKGMIHFTTQPSTKKLYKDNLCVFRCIAKHLGRTDTGAPAELLHVYKPEANSRRFKGVPLYDFPLLEQLFNIQIGAYTLRKKNGHSDSTRVKIVYTPSISHAQNGKMNINLYQKHASLIVNFERYADIFTCESCDKLFSSRKTLNRHLKTTRPCTKVKLTYRGGVYKNKPTVFEELDMFGIQVNDERLKIYPYKITYDFEAYFKKPQSSLDTSKIKFEANHLPLSASVASDFPGYQEAVCFIRNSDAVSDLLVKRVFTYITNLALVIGDSVKRQHQETLDMLNEAIKTALEMEKEVSSKVKGKSPYKKHPLLALKNRYMRWIEQVPVVGFNSGKYDLNLIKKTFHQFLQETEGEDKIHVTKRNNQYLSISTRHFILLDILNYLAPGYSYANYLKGFTKSEVKGFFPYDWMTSVRKLNNTTLPPQYVWYNKLTKSSISAEDYASCQKLWVDEKMETFRDYLIHYNNSDVKPFINALNNHCSFFTARGIDMFKDGITLPGLTLRFLFQKVDQKVSYVLFNQRDRKLHELLQSQLVGGPAIIFHRHHEKNVTKIREHDYGAEARICKHLLGVDANSLYLKCMWEKHCSGFYVCRKYENGFKPEIHQRISQAALEWLKYIENTKNIQLQHQLSGGEVRLGGRCIPVDGYNSRTQDVYQFHGCYFHGHDCDLTTRMDSDEKVIKQQRTTRVRDYLQGLGHKVFEMCECEWNTIKKTTSHLNSTRCFYKKGFMTEKQIIADVEKGVLFGLVQVDIETPEHLKDHFKEMTPIFKNIEVSIEASGEHMHTFAVENNLFKPAKRMLIGSYFAEKILFGTPLLQWYLEHGLVVTKVHQVIQYDPDNTFQSFVDEVTNARREGDHNPDSKILSDLYKLCGNSSYGKTITNQKKHTHVKYVNSEKATKLINQWRFMQAQELNTDLYEVQMQLSAIQFNLPIQIGFMVYQYAKLKMLQFAFDFLDKFISRRDYQLCEMDTDSLYMALSGESLDDLVKPELRHNYFIEKRKWMPVPACEKHYNEYVHTKTRNETWTAAECCLAQLRYDARTPGLFKSEWEGDGMLYLNAKTYICFTHSQNDNPNVLYINDKWSAKGVVKKQNKLTPEHFFNVLKTKKSQTVTNTNFKLVNQEMYTYSTSKIGLSYLYIKRRVSEDGVSTSPLNI